MLFEHQVCQEAWAAVKGLGFANLGLTFGEKDQDLGFGLKLP